MPAPYSLTFEQLRALTRLGGQGFGIDRALARYDGTLLLSLSTRTGAPFDRYRRDVVISPDGRVDDIEA